MCPDRSCSRTCAGLSCRRGYRLPILPACARPLRLSRLLSWASMRDAATEDKSKNGCRLIDDLCSRDDRGYFDPLGRGERFQDVKVFHAACRRAGVDDLRCHGLRQTFASHLVMAGVDDETAHLHFGEESEPPSLEGSRQDSCRARHRNHPSLEIPRPGLQRGKAGSPRWPSWLRVHRHRLCR